MGLAAGIYETILIILALSVLVSTLFHSFKISVILGYIVVGVIIGPFVADIVSSTQGADYLAEFGIIFLMFTIGLEFSKGKLLAMKKQVFGYGSIQVLLTIAATYLVSLFLPITLVEAFIIGSVIAMSSTAVVSKQLLEQRELYTIHGRNSISILLFQDLAVVPVVILIPGFADQTSIVTNLVTALLSGVVIIGMILAIGHLVLRHLLQIVAKTHSLELFALTALLITLGSAWLTNYFGLSLALGAFLAGILLSDTQYRPQIEASINPLRDIFLGFFFISLGINLDIAVIFSAWHWLLLLIGALILFKVLLISLICRIFSNPSLGSVRTGIILAQGGEFGFLIISLALDYQIFPEDYAQVVLGGILLSMALASIFIRYNKQIANFIVKTEARDDQQVANKILTKTRELRNHVIICGFGQVGQNIAKFLQKAKIPYVAFDLDNILVSETKLVGEPIFYADATNLQILHAANLDHAAAVIVCFSRYDNVFKVLELIRARTKKLPIFIRTHDDSELDSLYAKGATEVVPETLEISLNMVLHLLLTLKMPYTEVAKWIDQAKKNRYDLLRMVFPEHADVTEFAAANGNEHRGMHAIILTPGAYAINQTVLDLKLDSLDLRIATIRRYKARLVEPQASTKLLVNDVVVVYGPVKQLTAAEGWLLNGEWPEQ